MVLEVPQDLMPGVMQRSDGPLRTELLITRSVFMSPQYSVFFNAECESSEWNDTWDMDYHFTNPLLKLSILIGGDGTHGVVNLIDRLCFFEGGGVANQYRVDPLVLTAVLCGVVLPETLMVVQERFDHTLSERRGCLRRIQEELERLNGGTEEPKEYVFPKSRVRTTM